MIYSAQLVLLRVVKLRKLTINGRDKYRQNFGSPLGIICLEERRSEIRAVKWNML
jgi:hypothetical protein